MSERRKFYEQSLEKAGEYLSNALDIYEALWRDFPEFRQETEEKTLIIIKTFEEGFKRTKESKA